MAKENKSTTCVHAGKIVNPQGGIVSPVFASTAYNYLDGKVSYPRYFNTPNQHAVGVKLAALENGEAGLLTSSGMAAITSSFLGLLQSGDHVIFDRNLYGGTYHAILHELVKYGVSYSFVQVQDGIATHVRDSTKMVYFETPSNPLLEIIDISQVVQEAKKHDLITVIDNTFASPINQNPIDQGVDVVLHSGTKYLGGHSDIICGAVITSERLMDPIRKTAINFGGNVNASIAALLERSLKTLALRVQKQNDNARQLADWLSDQKEVAQVYYPGLSTHRNHVIARSQMRDFGGMLSFELDTNPESLDRVLSHLNIIEPAISLGGVESTISHPARTSHAKMTTDEREQIGIRDNLMRLSTGIEGIDDLIGDLEQAFKHV